MRFIVDVEYDGDMRKLDKSESIELVDEIAETLARSKGDDWAVSRVGRQHFVKLATGTHEDEPWQQEER